MIVPVELSVKLTASGRAPKGGFALKPAEGASAAVPVSGLVLLPALPVVKMTRLLKLAALRRTRLKAGQECPIQFVQLREDLLYSRAELGCLEPGRQAEFMQQFHLKSEQGEWLRRKFWQVTQQAG